jgi:Mg2+ and Co2+ transporter CorA
MVEDLENIKDSLITAETRIFNGDERNMVEVLSNLSRELIDFKQTARVHQDIWEDMVRYDEAMIFGKDFLVYARDIRDEFNRIRELITNALQCGQQTNTACASYLCRRILAACAYIATCLLQKLIFIQTGRARPLCATAIAVQEADQ